jgi:spore germination protein YaaH
MFDRMSRPLTPKSWLWARGGHRHARPPILIGLATLVAVGASVWYPAHTAASDPALNGDLGPSIQYQESLSHASDKYEFKPGGVVTVPFRPRVGDSNLVGGAAPVALPAAKESGVAVPSTSTTPSVVQGSSLLRREVLGFLPYWEVGSTLNYDTISTLAYFGVGLNANLSNPADPAIGTLAKSGNGWNGWISTTMTNTINDAHSHGARVALTIESFAWDSAGQQYQSQILSTEAVRQRTVQSIVTEVVRRGVDGVNLDFEPVASGQKSNFVTFVRELRLALDQAHPGYELTFCANGAPGTYDLANLLAAGAADAVFIMAYDLRGGSPATTGSIDPMNGTNTYTLTSVVRTFLKYSPPSKIILGLPWYGHAWSVGQTTPPVAHALPASIPIYGDPATGVTYATAAGLAAQNPATTPCDPGQPVPCVTGEQYDTVEETAWVGYYGDYGGTQQTWRELYYDNARALGAKIDAIDDWDLRGLGIWALGYDNNNGNGDLTAVVASKLEGDPGTYTPLPPTRILDSRSGAGFSGALTSHVARVFQVTGVGGVPANATAVTGNLTVTQQTSLGYLYLGPNPVNNPTNSTLNFPAGDDRANAVTVALSSTGSLAVTYAAPTTGPIANVIFDVTGYFTPDLAGATYTPLTPTRLLDSRHGTGGISWPFSSHVAQSFQVTGSVVPAGAVAVTGNLTVTGQTSLGYLYVGPTAMNNPTSSTLNFPKGDDRANAVTVRLSGDGRLAITYAAPTLGPTANVIFDVTGYFAPGTAGARYVPLMPSRILDSRYGNGLSGAFGSHGARTLSIWGRGGVPFAATAVTGNLTVTQQTSLGYLSVGPVPVNDPTSSTLNFPTGDDRANAVAADLSPQGTLSITYAAPTLGPSAHVIFDITGYFVP